MKKLIRTLSMVLCMALLMTNMPVDALSEEVFVEAAPAELAVEFAEAETEMDAEAAGVQEEEAEPVTESEAVQENVPSTPETEAESVHMQEMTFMDVISQLNTAPVEADNVFSVEELELQCDDGLNLYEEGILAAPAEGDTYVFSSTDELIAYVDEFGVLHAKFSGEVIIGLSINGGEEYQLKVTVAAPAADVLSLTIERDTIGVGMKTRAQASQAGGYSWEGDAVKVAQDGTVIGIAPGQATITFTNADADESASIMVNVLPVPKPEQVHIAAEEVNLSAGESFNIGAVYAEGTMCEFSYETNAPHVAKVDEDGNVTALESGEAVITVWDKNNLFSYTLAQCTIHVAGEAESIAFTEELINIGKGDVLDIKDYIEITPKGASVGLSFATSHKANVTVDENGIVRGVKKGAANITVTTDNGLSAKIKVKAFNLPSASKISFSPKSLVLGRFETAEVPVKFASGYYGLYTLESSDENVLRVTEDGELIAEGFGEADVILSLKQKPSVQKRLPVKVLAEPTVIEASVDELVLAVGQSSTAVYGVNPDLENTHCGFIYAGGDEDIITVDAETGKVTAVGMGRTAVTIKANNSAASAECRVTVVGLDASNTTIGVGDSYDIAQMLQHPDGDDAGSYTFSSSNKKIASVTAEGIVKGVKKGNANITIKSEQGLSVKIKVKVLNKPSASKMKVAPETLVMGVGMMDELKVSFSSGYYGLYDVASSDRDVVAVSANGSLNAVSAGDAVITVSLKQKPSVKKTANIKVLPAPDSIEASLDAITLGKGQVSTALYGVIPGGEAMCDFIYTVDDGGVVSVDANTGKLTAVEKGTARVTITASNNPDAKAVCSVTVLDAPASLELSESLVYIGKGDVLDVRELIEIPEGSAAGYTFATSHKKNASVSADGIVKGVAKGAANITVTTHNGLSAKVKVKVYTLATATKMKVSPASVVLGEGMQETLDVSFTSGYYGLYEIRSNAENIAYVNDEGNIVAAGMGDAAITVRLKQNPSAYKTVNVKVLSAPDAIEASVKELKLGVGQVSDALHGVNPDAENSMCDFIYTVDDGGVVTVDAETGRLTAVSKGSARVTITASNNPDAKAVCSVTVLDQPKNIAAIEDALTIGKGDTFDITRLIALNEGSAAGYTFSSSNKKAASVNEEGIVKGVAKGSANITVTTHNGLSAKVKVTVKSAPGAVYIAPGSLQLGVGMKAALEVSFASSSYFSLYTLASSNEDVVSVDEYGNVTAHKQGSATITVTTQNGKVAKAEVAVLAPTSFVEFAQAEYVVSEGMRLKAELLVDDYSMDAFSYESDDAETVAIDENGMITGLKQGSANIYVSTENGIENSRICTVKVTAAPYELDFNDMPGLVIAKGYTIDLPQPFVLDAEGNEVPANLNYAFTQSGYASYASISGGTLKGLKAGTVVVRVTSHNGKTADFTVRVVADSIQKVELAHSSYTLYIGEGSADFVALNGSVMGATVNFGKPEYTSNNEDVAVVNEDGVVTAVAPGDAVITASAYDGTSAECSITVGRLTGSISFAENAAAVTEGDTLQLQPVFDEGCGARVSYTSSNMTVAVVDEAGLVTAMQPGDTEITATTHNGLTARLNLKVRALPESVFFRVAGLNLVVGEDVLLKPVLQKPAILPEDVEVDDSISYTSTDDTVARVAPDGTVTALKVGSATITAQTRNGLMADCVVTVLAAGSKVKTEFAWKSATIIMGDSAMLEFNLTADAFERGFTIESSDPEKLLVDDRNWTITAAGAAPEGVELTLTVNPDPAVLASVPQSVSCIVKVIEKSDISFSAEQVVLQRSGNGSAAALEIYNLPEDLIGTFEVYVEDPTIATYDVEKGLVQAIDLAGETRVICKVFDCEIACIVKVGPSYRALIISEYNNSKYTSSNLPFAGINVRNMRESLEMSLINGESYDITVLSSNPTQAQIKSAISSTFAGAREGDVSLVYIVSHGYYDKSGIDGYCFGTPGWDPAKPDTYITSDELFGWLSDVEGNVVLMLDSCKSGGFIRDTQSDLEAAGDIAVITAQVYSKNASYFVKNDGSSIEFLTYVLCAAFGYDYENEVYNGSLKADANGDGIVTVNECFSYTKSQTRSLVNEKMAYFKAGSSKGFLVPGVKTESALKSWNAQAPQYYIPSAMKDMAIFGV